MIYMLHARNTYYTIYYDQVTHCVMPTSTTITWRNLISPPLSLKTPQRRHHRLSKPPSLLLPIFYDSQLAVCRFINGASYGGLQHIVSSVAHKLAYFAAIIGSGRYVVSLEGVSSVRKIVLGPLKIMLLSSWWHGKCQVRTIVLESRHLY